MNDGLLTIAAIAVAYICFKFLRRLVVVSIFGALALGACLFVPVLASRAKSDIRPISELAQLIPTPIVQLIHGFFGSRGHGKRTAANIE
jgi:hypothetical protein